MKRRTASLRFEAIITEGIVFTIGEFSLISRLSVKTLRFYHEEGILLPDYIDEESGYRYYRKETVGRATVIKLLRDMDFTVGEIREMLQDYSDDTELLDHFEQKLQKTRERLMNLKKSESSLDEIIKSIRRIKMAGTHVTFEVREKEIDEMIFAGYRFKGKYEEIGDALKKIGRGVGRHINGSPMALYYDPEYREQDADIEAGFPIAKQIQKKGVASRILKGGKAVTIIHKGPYASIGESYKKVFLYIEENHLKALLPSREIYRKGPGLIFRGNPDHYLTEIQVMIE